MLKLLIKNLVRLIVGFIFPLSVLADLQYREFVGHAYDLNSERLLYTEHHSYLSRYQHQVLYRETDGKIFATKQLDYSQSYFSPDFVQENLRNGEIITSQKIDQEIEVRYKQSTISQIKKRRLNFNPNLVIDAGFDHFISQNWQSLIQGQAMNIDYLIPARTEYYQLTIQQVNCEDKNQTSNNMISNNQLSSSQSVYCFTVSAANFFISLFSSELKLSYEKLADGLRLSSFQGRSNICDTEGSYQDVKIFYRYPDSPTSLTGI